MKIHRTRESVEPREGAPRVIHCLIRTDSAYLTFADDYSAPATPENTRHVWAIIGTDYGWLHTKAGEIRFWQSKSGARHHLARHVSPSNYGARRDFRKIDLFDGQGRYIASTTWARDCAEALEYCTRAYTARFAR